MERIGYGKLQNTPSAKLVLPAIVTVDSEDKFLIGDLATTISLAGIHPAVVRRIKAQIELASQGRDLITAPSETKEEV